MEIVGFNRQSNKIIHHIMLAEYIKHVVFTNMHMMQHEYGING